MHMSVVSSLARPLDKLAGFGLALLKTFLLECVPVLLHLCRHPKHVDILEISLLQLVLLSRDRCGWYLTFYSSRNS